MAPMGVFPKEDKQMMCFDIAYARNDSYKEAQPNTVTEKGHSRVVPILPILSAIVTNSTKPSTSSTVPVAGV